jgi:membrane associated rhomboid family serine protease
VFPIISDRQSPGSSTITWAAAVGGAAVGAVLGAALVTGKKLGEKDDETKPDPGKGE